MDHPHKGLGGVGGEMRNETSLAENCLFCNIYPQALLFCVFFVYFPIIRSHVYRSQTERIGLFSGLLEVDVLVSRNHRF